MLHFLSLCYILNRIMCTSVHPIVLSESNIVIIMPINLYNAYPGNNVSKLYPSTLKIRHINPKKFTQKFHP